MSRWHLAKVGKSLLWCPGIPAKFPAKQHMDKSRKTRWEKRMLRWQIILAIGLPILFGLAFWFFTHALASSYGNSAR